MFDVEQKETNHQNARKQGKSEQKVHDRRNRDFKYRVSRKQIRADKVTKKSADLACKKKNAEQPS